MLYIKIKNGKAVSASDEYPGNEAIATRGAYENRNDWRTILDAQQRANELTNATKNLYIATDEGPHCSPQYDVIFAPKVGDEVSYSFNGDTYPCGKITAISKSLWRIATDAGRVFYRHHQSGAWVSNGTWSLVPGHRSERNPSF